MSTQPATVARILDLARGAGDVSARKMFGEYAVYLDGKVVGLICDDRLFLKPVPSLAALLPDAPDVPPYPGARPHIAPDAALNNPETLARALRLVADELPAPRPKPGRQR